jgi:transcription-repair coupling factor (superfamily II helicase)
MTEIQADRFSAETPEAEVEQAPATAEISDSAPNEALGLAQMLANLPGHGIILAAHSEAQAVRLAASARALASELNPLLLPGWDCLPFDRASPSRAVMGERMRALEILGRNGTRLLVASIETLAQRLPAPELRATLVIATGQCFSLAEFQADLDRLGYAVEDAAEQPGEVAIHGAVIDLVPADGGWPVRIRIDGGERFEVIGIDRFDPDTQRSREAVERLTIGPASELVFDNPQDRPEGAEHRLPELASALVSVFDLMPRAMLMLDPDSGDYMSEYLVQLDEARATRIALSRASGDELPPAGLYLDQAAWDAMREAHDAQVIDWPRAGDLPMFRTGRDPVAKADMYLEQQVAAGRRIGVSGRRLAQALDLDAEPVDGWVSLLALPPGGIGLLPDGLVSGFSTNETVVISVNDVLPPRHATPDHEGLFDVALRIGDAVIHLDYGMARLDGIETVDTGTPADCLLLDFAGNARKLVPCADMDRIWRYGAGSEGVRLDRADGSSWAKRRVEVLAGLLSTARTLVDQAGAQAKIEAPSINPPRRAMERFIAGFPYSPTPDQAAAFDSIAGDLATPRPMDRLLCGDVGFGKTEAALRAAAAVALSGRQVAILAPTTVLVRQHLATFRKRFAGLGVEVEALSRLSRAAEARTIRRRLADGSLRVVVGTQALADAEFADLALVVIDEEQRFGTKDKAALAGLRQGVHTLTLSATPIPRTLEGALTGMRTLSVLTTPPARRQPIRTSVMPFDEAVLKTALLRERSRGGQSFCVCPRISDLEEIAGLLERLVPDLSVVILHGKMKPDAMDAALAGFADGHGEVLLSTDIIEAGLDIPRANTILIWHAERFGLAQLHQLRGRVGRGRSRGMAWLFTNAKSPPGSAGVARLKALATNDRLGAGFAIAARDLDLRGAGDLVGEEQAGHAKLLGVELARHLLVQAMARARGEPVEDDSQPEMVLDIPGYIPENYMPDAGARIALHARLARPHDTAALAEELEDRFGPMPDAVRHLLAQSQLRAACVRLGVVRLEVGPMAAAAELRSEPTDMAELERKGRRLLLRNQSETSNQRLAVARRLLRLIARNASR